jgi:hypothetical protein
MKYLSIILVYLFFVLISCTQQKIKYSLTASYDSTHPYYNTINVFVDKSSGDDEIVYLTVAGLPDYLTANIDNSNNTPPFNSTISFSLSYFAEQNVSCWKNYDVTINARSASNVIRTCSCSFTYTPTDPAVAFDNHSFFSFGNCSVSGSNTHLVNVIRLDNGKILLLGFFQDMLYSYNIPAILNGRNKTITIPPYLENGFTFSGTGTFYSIHGTDSIGCNVNFSRSIGGAFDSCTTTMKETF